MEVGLIKPNAVNFEPHVHVDPAFVGALVAAMRGDGAGLVSVMESCTNGSFTRLAFEITGIKREVAAAGGRCVYLDEGASSPVELDGCGRIETSRFVAERLLANRRDFFYIDLAKLKTHSMTTVTLCLKNQWCFVDPRHRGPLHNDALHESIREVNRLFVPDLCIVEGLVATNHGHFPLKGFDGECLWNAGVLIAGRSAVATDAASCRLIGIDPATVEHVAMCARDRDVLDPPVTCLDPIDPSPAPFTGAILPYFPPDVVVHKGIERCCKEGCLLNPVCAVQVLAANYGGHGGFHMFMGKGHDPEEVDSCPAPVLVVGPCAEEEVFGRLAKRLGRRGVRLSRGHNNLKETLRCLIPLMGINILKISPLPLHRLAWAYLRHRLSGSRADVGFF
ncbi:MAG: DUF362 domain-containing protein [Deltaproteobacteria bacterium]|nr:DUF362 domain-containing protein [Deltaproteobacteria bacterium]